jgi:penicillin amidase
MDRDVLEKRLLAELGAGRSIEVVCRVEGIGQAEFLERWTRTAAARVPQMDGVRRAGVERSVEICRDRQGVPHVFAKSDADVFFGFGYAVAQDRLFQLDWLRRKGAGRLSEILGAEGLPQDRLARTVGLPRIAEAEWGKLPRETQNVLDSFSRGINAAINDAGDGLPIEFDLLDYRPEPWRPVDCLVIEGEFRWYLTGRFPVIAMPELAKRSLGDGALYRAFLTAEADDESILETDPAWSAAPRPARNGQKDSRVGQAVGDPDAAVGSNNWVIDGKRSASGRPMVASDPHIAMEAVSCWYEVHLAGGSFDVAGCAYVGMPAVIIGRNRRMTWGITNNICSQRDLYQEETSPEHPGCFLHAGQWRPAEERVETIAVRGQAAVSQRVVRSAIGPIVDEVLPEPANRTGPVSLRWLGAEHVGWLTALLKMNRAENCAAFRQSLEPWHVPTFSVVFADVDGNIGYQATGRIPLRHRPERGYRAAADADDQWDGLISFEHMPGVINPSRGFVVTANNRVADDSFPYPLAGTWTSGHRALRIRKALEARPTHTRDDHRRLQQDACSLRAVACVPGLCAMLDDDSSRVRERADVRQTVALLKDWNGDCLPELVAPLVFNVFFVDWCRRVAAERFAEEAVPLLAFGIEGLAALLLEEGATPAATEAKSARDWFAGDGQSARENCRRAVRETFRGTLDRLAERLGPDVAEWTWGRLHRMGLKHFLSVRGDLGLLLDQHGPGVRGDATTVCNTGRGPDFEAAMGAGFRMICDLGESPAGLWMVDGQSQSGHCGSPHYRDQLPTWLEGDYHFVPLDRAEAARQFTTTLTLESGNLA